MSKIQFTQAAKKLAKQTGLDNLNERQLKKLDANKDNKITQRDVQRLVRDAGLNKDRVINYSEIIAINKVLGTSTRAVRVDDEPEASKKLSTLGIRLTNPSGQVRGGETRVGGGEGRVRGGE